MPAGVFFREIIIYAIHYNLNNFVNIKCLFQKRFSKILEIYRFMEYQIGTLGISFPFFLITWKSPDNYEVKLNLRKYFFYASDNVIKIFRVYKL